MNDLFFTDKFILDLYINKPKRLNNIEQKILDRLCKKIDVVKEVYIQYKYDLSQAQSNEEVSTDSYIKLLKILMFYAESLSDLKFFNSALKLKDKLMLRLDKQTKKELLLLEKRIYLSNEW